MHNDAFFDDVKMPTRSRVILLNALHRQLAFLEGTDGFHGGLGGGHVGGVGDLLGDGGGADQDLVGA